MEDMREGWYIDKTGAVYRHDWAIKANPGRGLLRRDFNIGKEVLVGCRILYATYGSTWLEGNAYVLLQKDGKLYEVHASHCSCYGLEGQWRPDETSLVALRHRLRSEKWEVTPGSTRELLWLLSSLEKIGRV